MTMALWAVTIYLGIYEPSDSWQKLVDCQLKMRCPVHPHFCLTNYKFLGPQLDSWTPLCADPTVCAP